MIINIAICDDEQYMLADLSDRVKTYFTEQNFSVKIDEFSSGYALLNSVETYHLIFLDIQMEGIDGMELAKGLRKNQFLGFIIFITVLREYVFDSFEVQAYDYLLKPIAQDRFERTMDRISHSLQQSQEENLLIQKGNDCIIIPVLEILFCEVINRKVYIHTKKGTVINYYDRIENLEKRLEAMFFRCHRSYLVNLNHVRGFENGNALLSDGERIPVSRLRNQEFSNAILQFMKGR